MVAKPLCPLYKYIIKPLDRAYYPELRYPLDLFLEGGKAIKIIFKIGFIPKEQDFEEFSESDYEKYHKEVGETEGKMFRFVQGKMDETEYVFAFDEFEKEKLLEGSEVIRNLADDHLSESDDETLQYVARVMPYPFTKGTKYEKKNPK